MKFIKITILLSLFFIVVSCDVFDTEPYTTINTEVAVTNGSAANGLLRGAYDGLQSEDYYGLEFVLNNDLIADNAIYQGFFDSQLEIDQKAVPFTNFWLNSFWVDAYFVISIANNLIDLVPTLEDPLFDNRDQVLGEAFGLRALVYFDLLRYYGEHFDNNSTYGVPLMLTPVPLDYEQIPNLPRSSVAQTYDQILSDINTALPLIDGFEDFGRMNYWAALALRARVNLYRGDYAAAQADADAVIESGLFALEADLDNVYGTELSSESIFDVEFNDQDQNAYNTFLIRRDEYNVDPSLLAVFEPGDARAAFYGVARGRDRCFKYADPTNANNAKVFRLAEMYLIRSEAAALGSGDPNAGLLDLNIVRERAGLPALAAFTSMAEYEDALLQERRIELSYEGHRFFDLVRFDRIDTELGMTEDFRKVFPIPRDQLLVDEEGVLEQNPGYETL